MQAPSLIDGIQAIWTPPCGAMAQSDSAKDPELAARMKLLRETLGHKTGVDMADFLDVSPQRWNNVENGMALGKSLATRIKRKVPGVDLDWLMDGDADGLPFHLRAALTAPPQPPMPPAPPSKPARRPRR